MTADAWMGENFITAAQAVMMDTHDIGTRWQHVLMLLCNQDRNLFCGFKGQENQTRCLNRY